MEFQSFSPKQMTAITWWSRKELKHHDGILCDGAVRSGKTVSLAVGFLLWSMCCFENQTFALCGRTVESLRRNVTNLLPKWVEGLFTLEEKRSENRITVRSGGRKNDYYLFGGKDESSYALIQGITLAGVLLDEVALMPRSFVEQAIARCSVAGSKFWFNCNPAGSGHWFYRHWVCKSEERNLLHLHFTMEDNPALDEAVRRRYERLYTGAFYDRYVKGLWRSADGLVYDMFDPKRHIATENDGIRQQSTENDGIRQQSTENDGIRQQSTENDTVRQQSTKFDKMRQDATRSDSPCWVSVDYGTLNPTVFLLWRREGERWRCEKEYYWSGRDNRKQKTDGDYADDLAAFLGEIKPRSVVVDPSAASFIAELRRRGFKVLPADNAVLDGIRAVGELLRQDRLVFDRTCQRTRMEFESYVWDDAAAERGEDRPRKEDDHCMDAVRYFVATVVNRGASRVRKRPRWG